MTFDVIIVGAGPAGSFAAERLASNGVRVMLLDGRPEGQPKACGGGVTAKALKAWPQLLNAVGRTVNDLELYSPAGKRLSLKLGEPFAIYSRIAFDTYLRERASKAGARVCATKLTKRGICRTETGWSLQLPDEAQVAGKFLIGADGANSTVGKVVGQSLAASEMEIAFGYRAPLPTCQEPPTVVAFLPGWAGYAWAFPRLDHISFGIATTQEAFAHEPLDSLLWNFMLGYYRQREDSKAHLWCRRKADHERDERTRRELARTVERYAARIPGVGDKTWDSRKVYGAGWALVGDAAGFADPVTGEGIYYALRSAELFSECYLRGVPEAYEQRWREDFGRELKRAAQMRRRFYGNFWGAPFTERMIEFARSHRGIQRVLGDLVAGEQAYSDLKKKLARSALRPL